MILGFRDTSYKNLAIYSFMSFPILSLIFSLINKRKVYHSYQLQNFQKIHDSDDFGIYRSFCRRSDSLIAHVFLCRRSCSLSLTNFFFGEDPLVLSYRKSLPRCAIKFVTQPTRRNRSQQRLLVGWGF
jgi:hypothetical protein